MVDWILLALLCLAIGSAILSWVCACLDWVVTGMVFMIVSGVAMVAFGGLGGVIGYVGLIQNPPFLPGLFWLSTQLWAAYILGVVGCLGIAALGAWTVRVSAEALGLLADN